MVGDNLANRGPHSTDLKSYIDLINYWMIVSSPAGPSLSVPTSDQIPVGYNVVAKMEAGETPAKVAAEILALLNRSG
jgi:hypothetical protein